MGKVAPSMAHHFKTPTLRNVAERGPEYHDGSLRTLQEVVEFYDQGGREARETRAAAVRPLHLSPREKADLVAFLKTLTSREPAVEVPALPAQAEPSARRASRR